MNRWIKIYAPRLLKLASFLDELPRKRFDFRHWVGKDWKGAKDLSCGTTACAFGWATTIPAFRKAGLRLTSTGYSSEIWFKSLEGIEAAESFFSLEYKEARVLFVPFKSDYCPLSVLGLRSSPDTSGPKRVAAQIRKFVKRKIASLS